jgi:hypothetical protein
VLRLEEIKEIFDGEELHTTEELRRQVGDGVDKAGDAKHLEGV